MQYLRSRALHHALHGAIYGYRAYLDFSRYERDSNTAGQDWWDFYDLVPILGTR